MREENQVVSFIPFFICARWRVLDRLTLATLLVSGFILVPLTTISFADETNATNATVRQSPYFESRYKKEEREPKVEHQKLKAGKLLSVQELEQRMFDLINQDRAKAGIATLSQSPRLGKLARELADDMMVHKYFGHTTFAGLSTQQRAAHDGIECSVYENIGTQSGPDPASQMVDELEQSFMGEPEREKNHRYVLLLPGHTHVGVGIAKSKDCVIVVQDFADSDPSSDH